MNEQKPLILVTNDDGCQAKGLRKLVDLMRPLGDVVVISTDRVMSAKGHSITTTPTLTAMLVDVGPGYKEYVCNGTPVDCVKIGYQWLLDKMPDLVVSGINHGSNASTNVIYSGTMAAAIEASMDGIDAIGFSLDCYDLEADFDHLDGYITAMEARDVGLVSMHLGGGRATKESDIDLSVGLVLHKKVGDKVEAGESLGTIHASSLEKAEEAAELLRGCCELSDEPVERPAFIKDIIR